MRPGLGDLMFSDDELAGGKVNAFFDRVKIRDLYDLGNLNAYAGTLSEASEMQFHKVVLYFESLSATFPHGFEPRPDRFAYLSREYAEQLVPMLRAGDGGVGLTGLIEEARSFIVSRVLPRDDAERGYLERFASGEYRPELLFGQCEASARAKANPEALWKLQNLRRMALVRGTDGFI